MALIMQNISLFLRDLAKAIYLRTKDLHARVFHCEREASTSIAWNARLDIYSHQNKTGKLFKICKGAFIEQHAIINTWHGSVTVGQNSGVGISSVIIGPVAVGSNVRISQNCLIVGENRVLQDNAQGASGEEYSIDAVMIGDGVWIGANSNILPGVSIGDGSIIAAGSTVTRDIPANVLAAGNPASIKKHL